MLSKSSSSSAVLQNEFGPKDSYWNNPGEKPLSHLTIGALLDKAAARWPEREAAVAMWAREGAGGRRTHPGRQSITFAQAKHKADRLAAAFVESLGLRRGDRVAIWSYNSIEWYLTQMAAAKAGLVLVNINPAYWDQELLYSLRKVGAKALLAADKYRDRSNREMVEGVVAGPLADRPRSVRCGHLPELRSVVLLGQEKWEGFPHFDELIEGASDGALEEVRQLSSKIQPDQGCNIQFTSGTTGQPKAAFLSHHNVVNNAGFMVRRAGLEDMAHRICLQVPLFHCFGCVVGTIASLHCGATLVMPSPTFNAKASLTALTQEKCTAVYGTPTMYVDLLEEQGRQGGGPLRGGAEGWSGLEVAVNGGAPCSEHLLKRIMDSLGAKRVCSVYGMTETSPISFQTTTEDTLEQMLTTVGYVTEHVEVKVVNSEGEMVPMGTPGELWVRGYCNMIGYWGDDTRTRETIGEDRWLRTGDQFILMENGYGKIVGRFKDMIIRGGENIFPKEIEEFLQGHPSIAETQVFGIPDVRLGEVVCAWVRCKKGMSLTSEDLKEFCKGKIANFKIPKHVKFVEEFPKTVSGKIQKFKIQEMMEKEALVENGRDNGDSRQIL
ncbi:medium-chain acyl-CoA ligase ACSF2, mitochondrial isoform X2 [Ischnura elegans]|uniref:medium-chain acyl-CoA ligase ACSF2, mitochondrial isoform X2 n=1 Tax=Ischnura elegans TaxID=197161 RepID=UPI001ED8B197|nr:medium-chain acyl-CoA ligase ACSF2, mitochondrial isoform X2 [Ischnura elegans]